LDNTSIFANNLFGTFLEVDYRESSTKMVCFYTNQPSMHVDVKDNVDYVFRDDSFEITRSSNNPLAENQTDKKDWDKSNKVVGFSVDIGPQNQSIFHGFNVSQGNSQSTAESLEVINQMANQAGNRAVGTQNVSLYNLYKNRSYSCTISMMGNAMMQPTMYFNLRYVPMFHGPYMILKVTHSINPGNFETIVEGIRQPTASLPKVEQFLTLLKTNLLNSIIEESKRQKEAQDKAQKKAEDLKSQNQQINNFVTTNPSNTASANQTCTASSVYSTFTYENATKESKTTNEVVKAVKKYVSGTTLTQEYKDKLNLLLFSTVYIASATQTGFQANNNNFIGLNIQDNWGPNFTKKSYFCSSDNTPYVSFSNLEESVSFIFERWLYNAYDPSQLSSIESEVQAAINLFNSSNV